MFDSLLLYHHYPGKLYVIWRGSCICVERFASFEHLRQWVLMAAEPRNLANPRDMMCMLVSASTNQVLLPICVCTMFAIATSQQEWIESC